MADDALELSFDAAGDDAVIACWNRLRAAGLPSQADHARGMTNAPHLSAAVAATIQPAAREVARTTLLPLLPVALHVQGLIVLGARSRVSLAWLVELDAAAVRAVEQVRAQVSGLRHPLWLPHVTLARGVPRDRLGEAMAAIGPTAGVITADRLRWWDAAAGTIDTLTP